MMRRLRGFRGSTIAALQAVFPPSKRLGALARARPTRIFPAHSPEARKCDEQIVGATLLVTEEPAPEARDLFHHDSMIRRIAQLYETKFAAV